MGIFSVKVKYRLADISEAQCIVQGRGFSGGLVAIVLTLYFIVYISTIKRLSLHIIMITMLLIFLLPGAAPTDLDNIILCGRDRTYE